METEVELIADYACALGENPLWHTGENRLYWTDIHGGRLYWYDPATGDHAPCYAGDLVGGFTIQQDGALLLFMDRGAIKLRRDGRLAEVVEQIPGEEAHRFNDVIADPAGRVFCGTLCRTEDQPGRLYRLERDGTLHAVADGIGCSNGMGFTQDRTAMYHTDSQAQTIYRFGYDQATGALGDREVFVRIGEADVFPDGMTVDAEGGVWSALWGGSAVVRFGPDGREDRRIAVPTRNITSVAFGGGDLGDLYITTAGGDRRDQWGPHAGALFRTRPGVTGHPEFRSNIAVP